MKLKNILMITLMTTFFIILGTKVYAVTATINKDSTKLRKEPNSKVVLDLLEKNSEVEVIEEKDGWYKIKATTSLGKVTGYVSDAEIKIEGDSAKVENPVEEPSKKPEEKPVQKPVEEPAEKTETTETVAPVVTTGKIEEDKQYTLSQEVAVKALPLINSIEKAKISGNITVVEIINDWARVESDSDSGWVRINALRGALTLNSDVQLTEDAQENQQEQIQPEGAEPENVETKQEETKQEEPKKEETKEPEKTVETEINKVGYISAEGLRVRKGPSTDTDEITSLSKNDKVEIIGQSGNWYKIKIDGEVGYVSAKYVSDTKLPETTSRSGSTLKDNNTVQTENTVEQKQEEVPQTQEKPAEAPAPAPSTSTTGIAVVEYAKKYLGYKYVYGGTSPVTGFDCSGFTQYVYKQFGISLNRSSRDQAKNGVPVDKSELQAGDLLIFNNNANTQIGHVGIYMGDGNFIHASDAKSGVKITSLSAPNHAKKYVGARRVIN